MTRSFERGRSVMEKAAWIVTFALTFDGFIYMNAMSDGYAAAGDSRAWIVVLLLATYLGWCSFALAQRRLSVKKSDITNWLLIGVPVFCLVSTIWSAAPIETLKKASVYFAFSLFALSTYRRLGFYGVLFGIRRSILLCAALSVVAVYVLPSYAISFDNHEGAWKGVFAHKNTLGAVSAFGLTLQYLLYRAKILKGLPAILGGLVLLLCLGMSQSTTAMVTLVCSLSVAIAWPVFTKRGLGPVRHVALLAGALAAIFIYSNVSFADVAVLVGKDPTGTGRVPIWIAVWHEVLKHPFVGYGYEGYWHGTELRQGFVTNAIGFTVIHSHDGYLEASLSLGLLVFALALLAIVVRCVKFLGSNQPRIDKLSVATVLVFFFVYNITESAMINYSGGFWMAFLFIWLRITDRQSGTEQAARASYTPSVVGGC